MRKKWRYFTYCVIFFLYISLIIYNAICEFLFWNEFGTRYNFIAVDSLLHINGVNSNSLKSYPVIPMFSILILISLVITLFFVKRDKKKFSKFPSFKIKLANVIVYAGMIVGAIFLLNFDREQEISDNNYANELQANGLYKFYEASKNSSLNYDKFYAKLPVEKAFSIVTQKPDSLLQKNNIKIIRDSIPEIRKNVILVTIENLSSSFMKHFGNTENCTPYLDKLAEEGIFFTHLYATGNQPIKGLEALTLCIPPSPGMNLIKRENNENLFSTGYLFKKRDYSVRFFYGGYQDNINDFFDRNGYQVIDRKSFKPDEITSTGALGVCDEDLLNKALKVFDADVKKGKRFFGHIMTTSQRPFLHTSGKDKSLENNIKYTDYTIQKFIEKTKKHSWFPQTVFVFVSDCASTREKLNLDPENYPIPAVIYSPDFIYPQKITTLTSQIDVMPTLLGLLHFSYTSHFFGQDVFNPDYQPRAVMSTYQKLGYLKDNVLTVLSPNQEIEQFNVGTGGKLIKKEKVNKFLSEETVANYQATSYLIENNLLRVK